MSTYKGVEVYQNTEKSLMEVYKDLWRTEEGRDKRHVSITILISKNDSGDKTAKTDGVLDLTIANIFDRMKNHLEKFCVITDLMHRTE